MAVAVVLPSLQSSTGASFSQLTWVIESYLLSLTTFLATSRFLLGRLGRTRTLLAGSVAFTAGAALAGAAPATAVLIVARALQGAGSAFLVAAGPLVLTSTFGGEEALGRASSARREEPVTLAGPPGADGLRGANGPPVGAQPTGLAVWSTLTALAVASAPLAGGLVATELSWRYVFFLESALGAAGLAATLGRAATTERAGPGETGPPDWAGAGLFAGAATLLVVGLVRVTYNLESWVSSGVLACLGCTGLLLVAFVAKETVAAPPALPIGMFRRRSFAGASAAAFGLSFAVMGTFPVLAFYLARSFGYTSLGAGLRLLALAGMALPGLGAGALCAKWQRAHPSKWRRNKNTPAKWGSGRLPAASWLLVGGLALVACGLWLMSGTGPTSGWEALLPGLLVSGAGYELASPRLSAAAAAGLPLEEAPLAARASSTARQLGAVVGVALAVSLFATRLTTAIGHELGFSASLAGEPPAVASLVLGGHIAQASYLAGAGALRTAFAAAVHSVLVLGALVAAASALVTLVASADLAPARTRIPMASARGRLPAAQPSKEPS